MIDELRDSMVVVNSVEVKPLLKLVAIVLSEVEVLSFFEYQVIT